MYLFRRAAVALGLGLLVFAGGGGQARALARVTCRAPKGARIEYRTRTILVWFQSSYANDTETITYTGCLRSPGHRRRRVLTGDYPETSGSGVVAQQFASAGAYLAFDAQSFNHYGDTFDVVHVVNLRTGERRVDLGCACLPGYSNGTEVARAMSNLVVGSTGVAAWRVSATYVNYYATPSVPSYQYAIVGFGTTGSAALDHSITDDLANLSVHRSTVSWTHAGQPRSAVVQ